MRIEHGRGHTLVSEKLLDGADGVTILQEMGREGMAKGVAAGPLIDAGTTNCVSYGSLHG